MYKNIDVKDCDHSTTETEEPIIKILMRIENNLGGILGACLFAAFLLAVILIKLSLAL